MNRFALLLLGAFFVTFVVLIVIFATYSDGFMGFIDAWWADGTDTQYVLSVWGWCSVVILVFSLVAGIYFEYTDYMYFSIPLAVVAGVFLNLLLAGIYAKAIW
jgi:hypothetical protein